MNSDPECLFQPELEPIVQLTTRMLAAGEDRDWTLVGVLERQRYQILATLPPECFASANTAVARVLKDTLSSVEVLTAQVVRTRGVEQQALSEVRRAQQGTRRYLEHASPDL